MKRMFVTGDTHRLLDISKIDRFDEMIGNQLTADDYLFIVGDFGGVWTGDFDEEVQEYWEKKKYTILYVDGNHENHDALKLYPVEEWNGGKVNRIYNNVLHLIRGQVFTISKMTFFTMGGAKTTDIEGRIEGLSWWRQELPSEEEYEEALNNLSLFNFSVDYVLTHCCPEGVIRKQDSHFDRSPNTLTRFLDNLITAYKIQYRDWYFGHYHVDRDINRFHCLYNRVVELI